MKNLIKTSFWVTFIAVSFAFTEMPSNKFTGVYGVSGIDPSQIKLVLNDDYSFTYRDFSNSNRKINVDGIWELKNNTIILTSDHTNLRFHSKWKISDDGKVAKSRMAMTFYSLVKK